MKNHWKTYAITFGFLASFFLFTTPAPVLAQDCSCTISSTTGVSDSWCYDSARCPRGLGYYCVVLDTNTGQGQCNNAGIPTGTEAPQQGGTVSVKEVLAPTGTSTFSDFLCNIIGFFNTDILPPIAVFMTLLAGFFFMLSGQDPQKATQAKKILLYSVIGVALFLMAPGIVGLIADILGATGSFAPISCGSAMGADTVTGVLIKIVNWFAWFVALASVAMGLYAGFLYLTSRGMPQKVQQATKALSYVVIGVAISVVAFSIISIVQTFLE